MKQLFLILGMFALLVCMAMPNEVKACVHVGDEVDVGFVQGPVTASKVAAAPSLMMADAVSQLQPENPATHSSICPGALNLNTVTLIPVQWSGGDTKASRCEAVYGVAFVLPFLWMRNDGLEIRRLS